MPLNLLAICIGNTQTRLGTFVGEQFKQSIAVPNSSFTALSNQIERAFETLGDEEGSVVMVASTCPPLTHRVTEQVNKRLGVKAVRVEEDLRIPIGRKLDPEAIVGDDRLLNAAAAYDVLHQACVVIDAGTAMTVDFIDGEGTFHGGAIAPGARMMLHALTEGTSQLPEVELVEPQEPIGHNTVEAIRSGIFYGLRGIVRELTEHFAEIAGSYPIIIATGGDAELLFKDYDLVDRTVPDLTLIGMKLTLMGSK